MPIYGWSGDMPSLRRRDAVRGPLSHVPLGSPEGGHGSGARGVRPACRSSRFSAWHALNAG